ncbi:class E sortase [Streptomyces sp. N2-109]|uniref:Class E sortase n=1 Tax=Streptomyces gossypii TaxID=2883101 RepID=A0ABT2JMP5_9ACTN|nr:class E sortase [Streptomyces gossypii]MCT2589140.1 class E sortase [Streptomyces gossypii]
MTSVRPGHGGAGGDPYGGDPYEGDPSGEQHGGERYSGDPYGADQYVADPYAPPDPYAQPGAYEAAVDALADPLTDPLPGRLPGPEPGDTGPVDTAEVAGAPMTPVTAHSSPWFRPAQEPQRPQTQHSGVAETGWPPDTASYYEPYTAPYTEPYTEPVEPAPAPAPAPAPEPVNPAASHWAAPPDPAAGPMTPRVEWGSDLPASHGDVSETAALPLAELNLQQGPVPEPAPQPPAPARPRARSAASRAEEDERDSTVGLRRPEGAELGRAARRKAATTKGRSRKSTAPAAPPPRAGTRLEARRAARAAKDGPAVILSRFIGEVFITFGVLMLLFVAYQLWWTNVLAHQAAGKAVDDLEDRWKQSPERKPGKFEAGEGFAIMYIPKLDIRVPVAEGVDKQSVLDKGMVGHYDAKSGLKTAMPWDKKGNFSVAGHRNTHGEPFRYINKLVDGDVIIVETADTYYTYKMHSRLPSTSPSNTTVVQPVPPQSGFTKPGRYVTLTTCTPEFTSKYRLIVWGKMVEERPRSKGKPDALVG